MTDKMLEDEILRIFSDIVKGHPDYCAEDDGEMPDDLKPLVIKFWQAACASNAAERLEVVASWNKEHKRLEQQLAAKDKLLQVALNALHLETAYATDACKELIDTAITQIEEARK